MDFRSNVGKFLSALLFFIIAVGASFAQEKEVRGVVKDASGEPLPGVSVVVKGTTQGIETDFDGNFKLNVKVGGTLSFSYIGMKTKELKVGSSSVINVVLEEDAQELEAVVVTAYGTQTKASVAGSIQTIKTEDIAKTQASNIVQGLTGKVTGVQIRNTNGQPGSAPSVRFRGIGSISSSNDPLYVVDGVPFNGNIASISSQDIESITFLKDASANALYGSRGANGVIVITTKKGKSGNLSVTYDSKIGFTTRAVPEYDVVTDPREYYSLSWQRLKLGNRITNPTGTETDWNQFATDELVKDLGYNIFNVADNAIIDPATGLVNPSAQIRFQDSWEKYLFRTGVRQEQYLGLSYGNDRVSAFLSFGALNEDGYVINSGFDRYSGRLNTEFKVNDNIKVGANVNYAKTIMDSPLSGVSSGTFSNVFSWTRNIASIYPVFAYDRNGNLKYDTNGAPMIDFGTGETENPDGTAAEREYVTNQNPYGTLTKNVNRITRDNISSRAFVSVDFLKNFNFTYNLGYDVLNRADVRTAWGGGGDAANVGGRISNATSNSFTFTNQQLLGWKKDFGRHFLDIMIGHESSEYRDDMLVSQRTNVVIDGNSNLSNATKYAYTQGYSDFYRVEGYLSKFNYSYADKYFVNASYRRDGSSVFHPDNRWGDFFGFGVAWNLTREAFFPKTNVISNFKLKASYGEQGNDNLYYPDYVDFSHREFYSFSRNYLPYLTQYDIANNSAGDALIKQAYLGNKDLKWEVSKNLNAGFELSLFHNRLNIEAEFFKRAVSDMLYNFPLAPSSGNPSISRNVGDMENVGWEFSIDASVIRTDNWHLNLWANATTYKNKITRLPESYVSNNYFRFVEGESTYTFYLREFAGVDSDSGKGSWYVGGADDDGILNGQSRTTTETYTEATKYLSDKTAHPDWYGGFGLNLDYKKWSFATGFAYQLGGYIYDANYMSFFREGRGQGRSGGSFHKDIYNTWTLKNTNASLPYLTSEGASPQYSSSTLGLVGADYLSLENISLSYRLENDALSRVGLQSATFTLLANNLYVWSKRQGLDPRMVQLGGSSTNGATSNVYTPLRSVSLGVNLKF